MRREAETVFIEEQAGNNTETYKFLALEQEFYDSFDELDIDDGTKESVNGLLGPLRVKHPVTRPYYEHSLRVGLLCKKIARYMHLDEKALFLAGALHDVGKCQTPLETLGKTKDWTEKDTQEMEPHVIDSYRMIKGAEGDLDFAAEIIKLHHEFQANNYPKEIPPFPSEYSEATKVMLSDYGRILALADCYDSLHRKNDRYGDLSDEQIKEKMLELSSDEPTRRLIEDLYVEEIFKEFNPSLIPPERDKRYEELWEQQPQFPRTAAETSRHVMIAEVLENIVDKTGATGKHRNKTQYQKLEYLLTAGVNIGEAFRELAERIDVAQKQPDCIYDLAFKAQMDSQKNRDGGRANQDSIEILMPIVTAQHLYNSNGLLSAEQVLEKAQCVLQDTTQKDVEFLIKMRKLAYDMSYPHRKPLEYPDAENIFEYYTRGLKDADNGTSKIQNNEFVNGFPTIRKIFEEITKRKGASFTETMEHAFRVSLIMHKDKEFKDRGFLVPYSAAAAYLYLSQNPTEKIIT